ncbi:CAP domain-containing protein [Carnobacterium antarcticum]|uniref:CAP domain-containing protein n=1 Tax=Carnobacterium antarcticum TaxID=2126436 RepID=A0ABW4NMX4_9LACT|nr:CAP domain-containing protein [Carnobacterium sp. CP1]ALV21989.1 Transporter [Carnobacterium sp. CP1]
MKRFLSTVVMLALAIVIGFWLGSTNVLDGTKIGDALSFITEKIPVPQDWKILLPDESESSMPQVPNNKAAESSSSVPATIDEEDETSTIDYVAIEDHILELLNDLRQEKNLNALKPNEQLKKASRQRAKETKESFAHTRPDGREMATIFEEPEYEYVYQLVGENIGMATYYLDEEGMAELMFGGWKNSPGHYENMVRENFEEIGIGVYYDGETLYAAQLFGTPR